MTQYRLTLSSQQVAVVRDALELYARLRMGQLDEARHHVPATTGVKYDLKASHILRDRLLELVPIATGLGPNQYHSLKSGEVSPAARIAWDIQQVLRYAMWLARPEAERQKYPPWWVFARPPDRTSELCCLPDLEVTSEPAARKEAIARRQDR